MDFRWPFMGIPFAIALSQSCNMQPPLLCVCYSSLPHENFTPKRIPIRRNPKPCYLRACRNANEFPTAPSKPNCSNERLFYDFGCSIQFHGAAVAAAEAGCSSSFRFFCRRFNDLRARLRGSTLKWRNPWFKTHFPTMVTQYEVRRSRSNLTFPFYTLLKLGYVIVNDTSLVVWCLF